MPGLGHLDPKELKTTSEAIQICESKQSSLEPFLRDSPEDDVVMLVSAFAPFENRCSHRYDARPVGSFLIPGVCRVDAVKNDIKGAVGGALRSDLSQEKRAVLRY